MAHKFYDNRQQYSGDSGLDFSIPTDVAVPAKANGFNDWDRIAMLIAVQSIAVIIPLKLFCMSNLANKIQKLVSYFDEDLRNLTTQGMVSDWSGYNDSKKILLMILK